MSSVAHTRTGIQTTTCSLDTDEDIEISKAIACLDEAELKRMKRFVFPRDQLRFARGRGFLRHNLAQRLGVKAAEITLDQGQNGKPCVRGHAIAFNLSHSQDQAVLAIAKSGAVGIDLELADRQFAKGTDLADLAKRCFTQAEINVFLDCDLAEQQVRFLRFWTAKEARMKLWGEGMALDPKRIELHLKDGVPKGYKNEPEISLTEVEISHSAGICYCATS